MINALIFFVGIPLGILLLVGFLCDHGATDENGLQRELYREEARSQRQARALQLEQERDRLRAAQHLARLRDVEHQKAQQEILNALETIATAPDFRRAAAVIHKCEIVCPTERQRLFYKYRHAILRHAIACLHRHISPKHLAQTTQDLVASLAVEPFEAEYLLLAAAEAVEAMRPPPRVVTFGAELQREILFHEQRLQAIAEQLQDLDLREQLEESERTRHAIALLRLTDRGGGPSGVINTL